MADIIFIDNFDSFSYNLVDQFRRLQHNVTVYRNRVPVATIAAAIAQLEQPVIVLSPGPGKPSNAGCMLQLIEQFKGIVPIIGICLGHQAIVEAYGGSIVAANNIVHGKTSQMSHYHHAVYQSVPSPLAIARYHSLVATKIPTCLTVLSEVEGMVMSVIHSQHKVCGFQFHPESIMTTYGATILENTIRWACLQDEK